VGIELFLKKIKNNSFDSALMINRCMADIASREKPKRVWLNLSFYNIMVSESKL
jgi:hypothetical protein